MSVCRIHDPDDVVPGRICGRPLPCRDHDVEGSASTVPLVFLVAVACLLSVFVLALWPFAFAYDRFLSRKDRL